MSNLVKETSPFNRQRASQTTTVKLQRIRDHIVPSPGDRFTTQFMHPRLSDDGGERKVQEPAEQEVLL